MYYTKFRYIHDSRLVDSGGRVRVVTKMMSSGDTGTALSLLSIDNVHLGDRGNYTCKPASGGQASISLHVLEGQYIVSCSIYCFLQSIIPCIPLKDATISDHNDSETRQ